MRHIIIPCGAAKRTEPCHAGDMYIGAMHRLARQAADAIIAHGGGNLIILSARYGLISPHAWIAPYEQRINKPGAVTADELRTQAADFGLNDDTVIALLPKPYSNALRNASIRIDHDVLTGTRTMGEQRHRLAQLRHGHLEVQV